MTRTLMPSTTRNCPSCGQNRSPLGYARASDVHVYTPQYHQLEPAALMAAYQQEVLTRLRQLLDYDKILAWACTTPRLLVGSAQRKEGHPLRRYLNDVDPSPSGRARWEVYPSACQALKRFAHVPHTTGLTLFEGFHIQPTGATFTVYVPLPSWTVGIMAQLQAFPFDQNITREQFVTLLRARA